MASAPLIRRRRVTRSTTKRNELYTVACKYLQESKKSENNSAIITKVWGEKLTTLNMQQRMFAEKAINDILFEAGLGNLHKFSIKINDYIKDRECVSIQSSTSGINSSYASPFDNLHVQGQYYQDGNRFSTSFSHYTGM